MHAEGISPAKHFGKVLQAREHAGDRINLSFRRPCHPLRQAGCTRISGQLSIWGGTHGVARRALQNQTQQGHVCKRCNSPPYAQAVRHMLRFIELDEVNIMRQGAIHHLLDMYRTTANYSEI
jgi:hypothetical protein